MAEWGSAADWVTAGVAFAALVVAAFAARATVETNRAQQRTLELQRQQFDHLRTESRRTQASKVNFWLEFASTASGMTVAVFVVNASDMPIFEVSCRIPGGPLGADLRTLHYERVLLPWVDGDHSFCVAAVSEAESTMLTEVDDVGWVQIRFVDSAGFIWVRSYAGHLYSADDQGPLFGPRADGMAC